MTIKLKPKPKPKPKHKFQIDDHDISKKARFCGSDDNKKVRFDAKLETFSGGDFRFHFRT